VDFWDLIERKGEIGPPKDDGKDGGKVVEFEPCLHQGDGGLQMVATATRLVHKKTKKSVDPYFRRRELTEDIVFLFDSGWEILGCIGSGAVRSETMAAISSAKLDPQSVELPFHIVKSGNENEVSL